MKAPADKWRVEGDKLIPRRGGASGSWVEDQKPAQPAQQTMDPSYRNISGMS